MNLEQTMAELRSKIEGAGNPAEALAALAAETQFDPDATNATLQGLEAQLTAATGLVTGLATAGPALSELNLLISEMRLFLPDDVVRTGELVTEVAMALYMFSPILPPAARLQLGGMFSTAVNVYANAVRNEVGLNFYTSDKTDWTQPAQKLDELAKEQEN